MLYSIFHLSFFYHLSRVGWWGQQHKPGSPDFPRSYFAQLFQGDPEAFPGQPRDIIPPACPESSWGLRLEGRVLRTLPGRHPGDILFWGLSNFIWLFWTQRSNSSTPGSSQMTELLTLSLRESPANLLRKLILAACTQHLVVSVTTQRLDHMWG